MMGELTEYEQYARDRASERIQHELDIKRARAEVEAGCANRIADLEAQVRAAEDAHIRERRTVTYIVTEAKGSNRVKMQALREYLEVES